MQTTLTNLEEKYLLFIHGKHRITFGGWHRCSIILGLHSGWLITQTLRLSRQKTGFVLLSPRHDPRLHRASLQPDGAF